MTRGTGLLICDGQFGSTGKGAIAGFLAKKVKPDTLVTAWSANAGHTYIDENGRKFVHSMLANGIVSPNLKRVLIGPGSQMNLHVLANEMQQCEDILKGVDILIHPHAAIIEQRHIDEEAGPMTKIGSTKKGCGAALIEKIRRNPESKVLAKDVLDNYGMGRFLATQEEYDNALDLCRVLQVEGAQGYSLGINSGFWPYVTSRECTAAQICIDCRVPLDYISDIVIAVRTFPIRVANRYNDAGEQVGWSGPCYSDQEEMTWEELGREPEFTTVTKLKRRVFSFSKQQVQEAIRMNHLRGTKTHLFLSFVDYLKGGIDDPLVTAIDKVAREQNSQISWLSTGPNHKDIVEL
jgi:adenylosuccinate synthase